MSRKVYTVVDVMPPGFEFPAECEIWVTAGTFRSPPRPLQPGKGMDGKGHDLLVFARLKPDVTVDQARAELTTISTQLIELYPDAWLGSQVDVVPLADEIAGDMKRALWVLVGAVASVLLIACANIANLLLARAATREREIVAAAAKDRPIDVLIIVDHGIVPGDGKKPKKDALDAALQKSMQGFGDGVPIAPTYFGKMDSFLVDGGTIVLGGCNVGRNTRYCNAIAENAGATVIASQTDVSYHQSRLEYILGRPIPIVGDWKLFPPPDEQPPLEPDDLGLTQRPRR